MDLVDQPRAYYRLHGSPPGPKMHAHTYTDKDLRRILGFCDEVDESYVLFDNIAMYGDALRFSAMLAQR